MVGALCLRDTLRSPGGQWLVSRWSAADTVQYLLIVDTTRPNEEPTRTTQSEKRGEAMIKRSALYLQLRLYADHRLSEFLLYNSYFYFTTVSLQKLLYLNFSEIVSGG